jgi:hypothetical protein
VGEKKNLMQVQAKYAKLQQEAVTRFRSKFHAQTDFTKDKKFLREHGGRVVSADELFQSEEKKQLAKEIMSVSGKLIRLQQEHTKVPSNVQLVAAAKEALKQIPKYSFEEDNQFVVSSRVLKTAIHFRIPPGLSPDDPINRALDIYIRHTYMFDAKVAASFVSYVGALQPTNAPALLKAVAPRLIELASEFLVHECSAILTTFARSRVFDAALATAVSENVLHYALDAQVTDIVRAAAAVVRISTKETCGEFFKNLTPILKDRFEELTTKDVIALTKAFGRLGQCDRRLSNSLAQKALRNLSELSAMDIAEMMHAFQRFNIKHEPFMRRCAMRQLLLVQEEEKHTIQSISLTLSAISHFHLKEHDVFTSLGEKLSDLLSRETISGYHCATILHSFARNRTTILPKLFQTLLERFEIEARRSNGSSSDQSQVDRLSGYSFASIFYSISVLELHKYHQNFDAIRGIVVALFDGGEARLEELHGNVIWFEMMSEAVKRMITPAAGAAGEGFGAAAVVLPGGLESALKPLIDRFGPRSSVRSLGSERPAGGATTKDR